MIRKDEILDASSMRDSYGDFYEKGGGIEFDLEDVPEAFRSIQAYARFWGVSDEGEMDTLVRYAPPDIRDNLIWVFELYDDRLDDWLAGPEADAEVCTAAYIAYTCFRMAGDYAKGFS